MDIDWSQAPEWATELRLSEVGYKHFVNPNLQIFWMLDNEMDKNHEKGSPYDKGSSVDKSKIIATRPQEQGNNMPELLEGDRLTFDIGVLNFYDPESVISICCSKPDINRIISVHRAGKLIWSKPDIKKQAEDVWRKHNKGVSGSEAREIIAVLDNAGMLKEPE